MKIAIPENKTFMHQCIIPIRWGDMDAVGHVNNTNYIRYLEIARTEWMLQMRDASGAAYPAKTGPIIVNVFCNFYREITYPNNVQITLYVSEPGRTSNDCFMEMRDPNDPNILYADGGTTMVWIDFAKKKPTPLPEWYLDLVKAQM